MSEPTRSFFGLPLLVGFLLGALVVGMPGYCLHYWQVQTERETFAQMLEERARAEAQANLKRIGLAVQNYGKQPEGKAPEGEAIKNLLPFIEQNKGGKEGEKR